MDAIEIFKEICKIPHCSHNTFALRDFIESFCLDSGCFVEIDTAGNILARKGKPTVCLQSHYDMVCIGDAPPVEVLEEGGYLKAKNSSLGADNGIGVAIMLGFAKKAADIELLFTNDEEVGLIGANNLSLKIRSKKILNLDTEEFGKVYIGCAGGVDLKATGSFNRIDLRDEDIYTLTLEGLPGGHSGVDIDKNIPNAIKKMALFLKKFYPKIISIQGGEALNSIPKSIEVTVAVKKGASLPKDSLIKVEKAEQFSKIGYFEESRRLIDTLVAFCNGVRGYESRFSIPSKSVNLSKIQTINDTIVLDIFPRANSNEELEELKDELESFFGLCGFKVEFSHQYPGWKPVVNEFSKEVLEVCREFDEGASFVAIHAGLECGVLLERLGDEKLIASIGPNIYNPHSASEKCEIDSVIKIEKIVQKLVR